MSIPLTLILSLAAALIASTTKKYYTDKSSRALSGVFIFNAVGSIIAATVLLLWGGFGTVSLFTALLGLVFGVITALQGIANIAALQCGPMSYTTVIMYFSTLISALSGVAFFGEHLVWPQIVGIILMLVSFVFATESNTAEKKANLKWLMLSLAAFLATGGVGIMQKIHQSSVYKSELNAFLVIAFSSSALLCAMFALVFKKKEKKQKADVQQSRNTILILLAVMLINGICVALNNKFNLYLSGVMESAVFFPIVNGGGVVLTTVTAVIIFKERLSKKQWAGIILGIISIVFICNPFS